MEKIFLHKSKRQKSHFAIPVKLVCGGSEEQTRKIEMDLELPAVASASAAASAVSETRGQPLQARS